MGTITHCAGCLSKITNENRQHANSWLCKTCFRTSRRCSMCEQVLPHNQFEARSHRCSECCKKARRPGKKKCATCGETLFAYEFAMNANDCPQCYGKRRRCTSCNKICQLDDFHRTASGQGLRRVCKECVAVQRSDAYRSRKKTCDVCGKVKSSFPLRSNVCGECHGKHRRCGKCKNVKAIDSFYRDTRRVTGRQTHCKECVKAIESQSRKKSTRICQGCKSDLPLEKYRNLTDKICIPCRTATVKMCVICCKEKSISEFSKIKDPRSVNGHERRCKQCLSDKQRLSNKTPRGRYNQAKHSAKRGGYTFGIDFDDYLALLSQDCHYCRHPLNETGSGLDRIDPRDGYMSDNVVPCCHPCNWTKSDYFTYEEMLVIGETINRVKSARAHRVNQKTETV